MDFLKLHSDGAFVVANLRFAGIEEAGTGVRIVKRPYSNGDRKQLNGRAADSAYWLNTNHLLNPPAPIFSRPSHLHLAVLLHGEKKEENGCFRTGFGRKLCRRGQVTGTQGWKSGVCRRRSARRRGGRKTGKK
jgi:hypothetical protein